MILKQFANKFINSRKEKINCFIDSKFQKSSQNFGFCVIKTLNPTKPTGKLTILPTPIGNMADLSPNIIKALFKADIIGC